MNFSTIQSTAFQKKKQAASSVARFHHLFQDSYEMCITALNPRGDVEEIGHTRNIAALGVTKIVLNYKLIIGALMGTLVALCLLSMIWIVWRIDKYGVRGLRQAITINESLPLYSREDPVTNTQATVHTSTFCVSSHLAGSGNGGGDSGPTEVDQTSIASSYRTIDPTIPPPVYSGRGSDSINDDLGMEL
jgi:hypothetical protein